MSTVELPGRGPGVVRGAPPHAPAPALRLVVLAFVVAYFFLPYDVRGWIPAWLPFLAAVWLEVQFFVGGYLAGAGAARRRRGRDPGRSRATSPSSAATHWREATTLEVEGRAALRPDRGPDGRGGRGADRRVR